jgi:hypothetical protein
MVYVSPVYSTTAVTNRPKRSNVVLGSDYSGDMPSLFISSRDNVSVTWHIPSGTISRLGRYFKIQTTTHSHYEKAPLKQFTFCDVSDQLNDSK